MSISSRMDAEVAKMTVYGFFIGSLELSKFARLEAGKWAKVSYRKQMAGVLQGP